MHSLMVVLDRLLEAAREARCDLGLPATVMIMGRGTMATEAVLLGLTDPAGPNGLQRAFLAQFVTVGPDRQAIRQPSHKPRATTQQDGRPRPVPVAAVARKTL
jgi:hypothetical protein